jgi:hypothetical protein
VDPPTRIKILISSKNGNKNDTAEQGRTKGSGSWVLVYKFQPERVGVQIY